MRLYSERLEFLKKSVALLEEAAIEVAPVLYDREAAMIVLSGGKAPAEIVRPLSVCHNATIRISVGSDLGGPHWAVARIALGLTDHGTIPPPDPYAVLAGMLATEELQQAAVEAVESTLLWLRGFREDLRGAEGPEED